MSVHLDKNSKIDVVDSKGIQTDNIVSFGPLCDVFMTQDQLRILYDKISKFFKKE